MINWVIPLAFAGLSCISDLTTICNVKLGHCHDGDTFDIDLPAGYYPVFSSKMPIRVNGIDAPEMNSKKKCEVVAAKASRDFMTQKLFSAHQVDLANIARDKYFRLDATVMVDGKDLGKMMIDAGLAVPYSGGTKHPFICKKEK